MKTQKLGSVEFVKTFTTMATNKNTTCNEQELPVKKRSTDFLFGRWLSRPPPGDEVVITGMSGRFPESNNVYEFRDNLFNKKDMVTDDDRRWKLDHPDLPQRAAKIYNIDKFDPGYFGMHYRQAHTMDPMMRSCMESAMEAIMDAGVNPSELEGSRTGVFVSICFSDTASTILNEIKQPQQFGMTGFLKSLVARRISYYLKLKGPSYVIDTACSSSSNALDQAFKTIRCGQCDNALVIASNVIQCPGSTMQFFRLGVLSRDGKCKVFDETADGYVRGEATASIFLQKANYSRRIYGRVMCTKSNSDGYKEQGITFPSIEIQKQLMTEIYDELGMDFCDLNYLEAHGTGTQVGDPQEVEAVDCAIAKKRKTPLWIGSVKSSIGHTEPASGLCSIIKVLIAMETGRIPPNINLNKIRKGMEGFEQGRLKAVTETTDLEGEEAIVGINNFGFGGSNCHTVIRRVNKKKNLERQANLPRLVCVSGRTTDSVLAIFDDLNKRQVDSEYIGLLHQIFNKNIADHPYRGYAIISDNGTIITSSQRVTNQRPSLYIIFGNFENCFRSVGRNFLDFPPFKTTMLRINKILSSENINIIEILQGKTENVSNLLGVVAVQVGIVNILKSLKLNPTAVHGDSFQELVCAYFNETVNLEETVLTALKVGRKSPKIISEMALKELEQLSTKRRSAYTLKTNRNMNNFKILHDESLSYKDLRQVSDKSVLLNFSEKHLNGINLAHAENIAIKFLEALGSLYEQGYNPQLDKLYPEIIYPVSRGTPMFSPLIKWDHHENWYTYKFSHFQISNSQQIQRHISILHEDYKYIAGHVIDRRNLFPATEYLNLVWQTFAQSRKLLITDVPIVFEKCKFVKAVTVPKSDFVKLLITIQQGSGNFEVVEEDSVVVSGRVFSPDEIKNYQTEWRPFVLNEMDPTNILEQDEIYKELYLRGYNYSDLFKGVVKCNAEASTGLVKWENNWTTFLDTMLQIKILQFDTRLLYVPTEIKKLVIDPLKFLETVEKYIDGECLVPVHVYKENNIIKTEGIEIYGLQATAISKRKPPIEPVLEKYQFIPNYALLNLTQSARVNTQIILENCSEINFKAIEIIDEFTKSENGNLLSLINEALQDIPLVNPDLTISTKMVLEEIPGVKIENFVLTSTSDLLLIVGTNILSGSTFLKQSLSALGKNGFILTREEKHFAPSVMPEIEILTVHVTEAEKLILFRKSELLKFTKCIEIASQQFKWLPKLQRALRHEPNTLIYSQNQEFDGMIGLLNCIRREPGGGKIKGFFMIDKTSKFDPEDTFYSDQIKKNLAVNIYKDSKWGTYRHLVLDDATEVESEHCYANTTVNGLLSSLKWIEGPLTTRTNLKENQRLIHTYYSAVNFRDIMLASGRISYDVVSLDRIEQECLLGFEFSGIDSSGNRVIGMTSNRALSTLVVSDVSFLWPIPETWSLEDGATIPVVYITVVYALLMVTTLQPGQSILIHSATGGIGIAAIYVALYHGCEVFATVSTQEKKYFLRDKFPQIPDSHIGNSRDTSFEKMIKNETKGRGVDIVLNSLTGEKLKASLNCLARGGKFMEIGKFDLANDSSLKLMSIEKEITYHGAMLDIIFKNSPKLRKKLSKKISDGIRLGFIKPLPKTVFQRNEVETAFRYMTTGKHIGKILLKIRDEEKQKLVVPPKALFKCIPRFHCDSEKSYIIIGGLGGIGLELADWLVIRGAKKLILISTSGIKTGYAPQRIGHWKKYGVTVHISKIDVTTSQGCLKLIQESNKFGIIDGIFNLAVILKDALFEEQTEEKFLISFAPKANVATYLDLVTREHCPQLRYFVMFSSVSCGRGNVGQTNYGMANSIMERICEKRKQDGLPALAIQWGAIGDVGLVAKMQKQNKELVIGGTLQQKISSCFEVLEKFLAQDNPIVASMVVAEKSNKIYGLISASEAVAQVLGIKNLKTVSSHLTLAELGMDSMTGTEIIQILEKDFEIYITTKDVRSLTFAKLNEIEAEMKNNSKKTTINKIEQGTNFLLQYIPDSKMSDLPVVKLAGNGKQATTVFVLPGIEGVLSPLEPLVKNLKAEVLGVQYSYNNPEESIHEIAENIQQEILKYITKDQKFHVIGYSFGAVVAVELITLLESEGFIGNVVVIDGSPAYLTSAAKNYLPVETEDELQTMLLLKILSIMLPLDTLPQNKDKFMDCSSFDERIELAMSLIPPEISNKQKLERQAAVTLYKHFKAIRNYKFVHKKIKSTIKLLKAKYPMVVEIEDDYNLSEICEQPVQVTVLDGDHSSILRQKKLVEVLNNMIL